MTIILITVLILILIILAWLNQVVGYAVVEPVGKDSLIRIKLLSKKKRWEAWWGDWKAPVMFWAGLVIGTWLGWML